MNEDFDYNPPREVSANTLLVRLAAQRKRRARTLRNVLLVVTLALLALAYGFIQYSPIPALILIGAAVVSGSALWWVESHLERQALRR